MCYYLFHFYRMSHYNMSYLSMFFHMNHYLIITYNTDKLLKNNFLYNNNNFKSFYILNSYLKILNHLIHQYMNLCMHILEMLHLCNDNYYFLHIAYIFLLCYLLSYKKNILYHNN